MRLILVPLVAFLLVTGDCQLLVEVDQGESRALQYSVTNNEIKECNVTLPNNDVLQLLPNTTEIGSYDSRYRFSSGDEKTTCGLSIDSTIFLDSGVYLLSMTYTDNSTYEVSYNLRVKSRTTIWPNVPIKPYATKSAYIVLPDIEETIAKCYVTPPGQEELEVTVGSTVDTNLKQWSENSNSWCGVEIHDINGTLHSGIWKLTAALNDSHFYYNRISIEVQDSYELTGTTISATAIVGSSFAATVGIENASYCELTNPQGETDSVNVGQCSLSLPTPTNQHAGTWVASSGLKGSPNEVIDEIVVTVTENPYIYADWSANGAINGAIDLYCKVPATVSEICRFVSPNGTAISMTAGVGNDHYAPYHNATNDYTCGLTIRSPNTQDYGTWKCLTGNTTALRTGYITISAYATASRQDVSKGVVFSESYIAYAVYNTNLTLSCNAESSLNYCWFKHPNGSIYSSMPDAEVENALWTYTGEGLEVGSCGITFREVFYTDAGDWTCNMGIGDQMTDLSVPISVKVSSSALTLISTETSNVSKIVTLAIQSDVKALSYCRFIRPDGTGINAANADSDAKYRLVGDLSQGVCSLSISVLDDYVDIGTWTCAAKLQTESAELLETFTLMNETTTSGASTLGLPLLLLAVTIFQTIGFN